MTRQDAKTIWLKSVMCMATQMEALGFTHPHHHEQRHGEWRWRVDGDGGGDLASLVPWVRDVPYRDEYQPGDGARSLFMFLMWNFKPYKLVKRTVRFIRSLSGMDAFILVTALASWTLVPIANYVFWRMMHR